MLASLALAPLPVFAHEAPDSPYHWHITCERFQQRAVEIAEDENMSYEWRMKLIGYLMSKLEDPASCQINLVKAKLAVD